MLVRGRRVVLSDGIRAASLRIEDGLIVAIGEFDALAGDADVVDVGWWTISPGLVDSHVHINEPGRTDWEGFDSATRAAAAGGVTTLIDMPLNSIPASTSVEWLEAKRQAARGKLRVDVGFWGGIVPGNAAEIAAMAAAGVRGFKCFLTPSGVPEFEAVAEPDLRQAMPALRRAGGQLPLLVHAEDPSKLEAPTGDPQSYAAYVVSRPASAEASAIELIGRLSREFGTVVHIVHVSSAEGVDAVARLRDAGVPLTAETCQHYLTFAADAIADGATAFKCAPPIREPRHREALWNALANGTLDLVATDHSPSPLALKREATGDFFGAWGGIASLQLALPALWSGARARGFTELDVARWTSQQPARLAGLSGKGALAVGHDADFVVWDPDSTFVVHGHELEHRHPLTPYEGRPLAGVVRATYLRGECVWRDGQFQCPPSGRLL